METNTSWLKMVAKFSSTDTIISPNSSKPSTTLSSMIGTDVHAVVPPIDPLANVMVSVDGVI